MNRIYLFLFALLAAAGFSANAADFVIHINDNGTWRDIDLNWVADGYDEGSKTHQKHYQAHCWFENDLNGAEFWIIRDGGAATFKAQNSTTINSSSGGVSLGHVDLANVTPKANLNGDVDFVFDFYYKTRNDGYGRDDENDKRTDHWLQVRVDNDAKKFSGKYYFYGDMNMWSSSNNQGQKVKVFSSADNDVEESKRTDYAEAIFGNNVPSYLTQAELDNNWVFRKVSDASDPKYKSFLNNHNVSDVNGWYYLDFAKLTDSEGHKGRLCGQFKITDGDHEGRFNWATYDGGYSSSYFGNTLKANVAPQSIKKSDGLQNMQLEANYIENAIIYFNPDQKLITFEGTPHYIYVYYGVVGGTPDVSKIKSTMIEDKQYNYYINATGYNDGDFNTVGGNPKQGNRFTWEVVTPTNNALDANNGIQYLKNGKVVYKGLQFDQVVRRRIPTGATHRFPYAINVEFSDENTVYPETRVNCDDIWYINTSNSTVNVYFRYDDDNATNTLDWVCYNIFNNNYANNVKIGYDYLFGGTKGFKDNQPRITDGEFAVMELVQHQRPGDPEEYWWWKSPIPVPAEFTTNSWVIFGESRGGVYPVDRVSADTYDLVEVAMNGEDLYYVATTKKNPSLLYSHLNGTFNRDQSESKTVQINAEFFDPDSMDSANPTLITDRGQVKYRFEIWKDGEMIVNSGEYSEKPFYDWIMKDNTWNGYYYVIVRAEYNGKIYTAQDTYAVYTNEKD